MTEENAIEAAVEEFLERIRIGDVPDIDTFAAEHPGHAQELKDILPVLVGVERYAQTGADDDALPMPNLDACGYHLLRKIGVGGMGVVYEALQTGLNRHVAVKLLRPSLFADPEIRELFRREARILAMLRHPGIVRVLDTGMHNDTLFYVMELIPGRRLDHLDAPTDESLALTWAHEAADALVHAHEHGIVHADVKPANLLLDGEGHIRVADFGLAFACHHPPKDADAKNGTLRYMPPERQEGTIDFSGDQYALGVSFAELLSGHPFTGPADIDALSCGRDFRAVLRKSTQAKPADRYASMRDLADDLRRIRQHEPIMAEPVHLPRRIVLFCRRQPLYTLLILVCILFSCAQTRSLIKGHAALTLARSNARTANAAISQVFNTVVDLPPSTENVSLLTALLPHYEKIVANPNIPRQELEDALMKLSHTALRTGNYRQAEKTLRQLLTYGETSERLRLLSIALIEQGSNEEADALRHQLAEHFASGRPNERIDSVWALLHLPQSTVNDQKILARIRTLLAEKPVADETLMLYAQYLLKHPGEKTNVDGVPNDPLLLLNDLSDRHVDAVRYVLQFVRAVTEKIQENKSDDWYDFMESALMKSDLLIGRFQNHPSAVSSAIALRRAYANWLRDCGLHRDSIREHEKVKGLISMLFNQPDFPDSEKEYLINEQLTRMEKWYGDMTNDPDQDSYGRRHRHHDSPERRARFEKALFDKIESYRGPRRDEFLKRFNARQKGAAVDAQSHQK